MDFINVLWISKFKTQIIITNLKESIKISLNILDDLEVSQTDGLAGISHYFILHYKTDMK